jgi:hypothetical protein
MQVWMERAASYRVCPSRPWSAGALDPATGGGTQCSERHIGHAAGVTTTEIP